MTFDPDYIALCSRTTRVREQLDRDRLKLLGTPESSRYPDSLGDRMTRCAYKISMSTGDRINCIHLLDEGDCLLEEFKQYEITANPIQKTA